MFVCAWAGVHCHSGNMGNILQDSVLFSHLGLGNWTPLVSLKSPLNLGMGAHTCNPSTRRREQEDHCKFQAMLGYIAHFSPDEATKWDSQKINKYVNKISLKTATSLVTFQPYVLTQRIKVWEYNFILLCINAMDTHRTGSPIVTAFHVLRLIRTYTINSWVNSAV